MRENYVLIGHTKKAHGAKGEIKVSIREEYLEDFVASEVVFIPVSGKPLPFFIEAVRESDTLLLKLEGIDNPGDALQVASKELFLRNEDITEVFSGPEKGSGLRFARFIGYQLFDAEIGLIGEILGVVEFPQQEMALVSYKNNEVYIPLHDSLIVAADDKNKTLTLQLPEGILDINAT